MDARLKQRQSPRILHLATHGFFLEDQKRDPNDERFGSGSMSFSESGMQRLAGTRFENPLLRSGLALANANLHNPGNDDGILTALEASGLNLWGTELVVLSGCDTGVGEVRNGEGVYGLRRAFVLAGAESLVMSLWSVSDYTTRDLMSRYYKNLKQNMGRGEALRAVQIEMLKQNPRLHPFFWASFIQTGEWTKLADKR